MGLQRYEQRNEDIRRAFASLKRAHPERLRRRIDLSFCTLMFGLEDAADSIERLARHGYAYVELLGNCAGPGAGNAGQLKAIRRALQATGMRVSGVCGSTQRGFTLESRDFFAKQRAQELIRRNVAFCAELGGGYYLLTPGTTDGGAPAPDGGDWDRSVQALREVADVFTEHGVACAVEPILKSITPICHNFADAKRYIGAVNHPGVRHIYGDTEHMMAGEEHPGQAILDAGEQLLNLHLKDTHEQRPIGNGMLDVDTLIRALYLAGFNQPGHFAVGEPLPDYYEPVAGYGTLIRHGAATLDLLARETIAVFREREAAVLEA